MTRIRYAAAPSPIRAGAAIVLTALAAWMVVETGLSDVLRAHDDGAAAYRLDAHSSAAAQAAAEQHLLENAPEAASREARVAIDRSPLNGRALRVLGLARLTAGDGAGSAEAMNVAAAYGWRDAPAQLWLLQAASNAGDYDAAALHLDALARTQGLDPRIYRVIDTAIGDPALRGAFAKRLVVASEWRRPYLVESLGLKGPPLLARGALVSAAIDAGARFDSNELNNLARALIGAGQLAQASTIWRRANGDRSRALVYDGSFAAVAEDPANATPLDWRIGSTAGATATVEQGDRGNQLHLETDGMAIGLLARQTLVAPAGPHVLSYAWSGPAPGDALRWEIYCASPSYPLALSAPHAGADGRTAQGFAVPAGCPAIELALRARPADMPKRIEATVRNVAIR